MATIASVFEQSMHFIPSLLSSQLSLYYRGKYPIGALSVGKKPVLGPSGQCPHTAASERIEAQEENLRIHSLFSILYTQKNFRTVTL